MQLDSFFKPNNLKISFFLTKGTPMSKVVFTIERAILSQARPTRAPLKKSCRICGNGFLPMNAGASTCEFCKTPFSGIVSGTIVPACNYTAAG